MNKYEERYNSLKARVDEKVNTFITKSLPETFYSPLKYALSGGGKRIRPMILLFSCEAAGGDFTSALDAAVAVELLHNFTLIHDDIMDNADKRRNIDTIHKKWDNNIAILAGDGLNALAYRSLLKTNSPRIEEITKVFTEGIIEVCEGQSYDKEFESRKNVSIEDYMLMINKKTAQLLVASAVIGVLIGGGDKEMIKTIEKYSENLGLAFQIQDDLFDIMADERTFGKKIGGDIREGKKTYLLIKALETINDPSDRAVLESIIQNQGLNKDEEILKVKHIYEKTGIVKSALSEIERYTLKADEYLNTLPDSEEKRQLQWFSGMLLNRSY